MSEILDAQAGVCVFVALATNYPSTPTPISIKSITLVENQCSLLSGLVDLKEMAF